CPPWLRNSAMDGPLSRPTRWRGRSGPPPLALVLISVGLLGMSGGAAVAVARPSSAPLEPSRSSPQFARHVVAVLDRLGCNAGACHGSFRGQNGFRLSLFGGDPALDYEGITHDALGRRINRADPEQSLLLLKPTGAVPHGGGLRLRPGSTEYRLL